MRIIMVLVGALIVIAGIIPLLGYGNMLPGSFPYEGTGYYLIVIGVGGFALAFAFINITLMGLSKIVAILVGAMTLLGGILPLLSSIAPSWLPLKGPMHAAMIILFGLLAIVYGIIGVG